MPDPVLMVSFSRLRGGSADRAKEQVLNVGARSADKHCEARAVATNENPSCAVQTNRLNKARK